MRNKIIEAANLLGVALDADRDTIHRAYRKAAKECHPDKPGGDVSRFQSLSAAFEFLSSEPQRKAYWSERQQWLAERNAVDCRRCGKPNRVRKGAGQKCGECGEQLTEWTFEGRLRQEGAKFMEGAVELAKDALGNTVGHAAKHGEELGRYAGELAIDWFRAKVGIPDKRGRR